MQTKITNPTQTETAFAPLRITSPKKKRKLPRGVRVFRRADRAGIFVQWPARISGEDVGKKRALRTKKFDTAELANAFAAGMADKLRDHGREVLNYDPRQFQQFLQMQAELDGADWTEVREVWRAHLLRRRRAAITLGKAIREHCEMLEQEGVTGGHFSHVELHLERLGDFFGEEASMIDVTTEGLREWLATLADEGDGGEGFSTETIKHHLKSARAFFNRAVAEHWIDETPADPKRVKGPKIVGREKVALSIEEAQALFRANREHRVCGRLALEAFGGLRYTSAMRFKREDVNWRDKLLVLPAAGHKSGQRHVLDNLPTNLWGWLKRADKIEKFWEMTERQYLEEKSAAFARAGVENPGNVLRRSFCSWRIALDGDAKRVAVMMQHRNPEMLYRQYKTSKTRTGFVTRREAGQWEKIMP